MTSLPFPMTSLGALRITGDDAQDFLQGQLSSDLTQVGAARGQLSGWHDPKGRALAFLRILPAEGGYLLLMHAGVLGAVMQRMKMFVLRAKVSIEPGPPVFALRAADAAEMLAAAGLADADQPLAAASLGPFSALRLPGETGWLMAGEASSGIGPEDPVAVAAWEAAEILAGLPEVYPETQGAFVAQMLNLDRIGAVSFTKGCYPGQEIVARAHHLGRVKRRARVFRATEAPGSALPAPGESLANSAGTVVRAAPVAGGCVLLAVVGADAAGPFTLPDGRTLEAVGRD